MFNGDWKVRDPPTCTFGREPADFDERVNC